MAEFESGWVIEHFSSPGYAPNYWAGNGWSTNNLEAVRFCRRIDAERTTKGFDDEFAMQHRIAEHGWG